MLEGLGGLLSILDEAHPAELVPVVQGHLARTFGATDTRLLVADYSQAVLSQAGSPPAGEVISVPVEGSDAGTAFREQRPVEAADGAGSVLYLPVSLRSERLAVLRVALPRPPDDATTASLGRLATTVAYVLHAAGRYTDTFERVRRFEQLSLPAEMQWALLPPRAFRCGRFALAGQMIPAYNVGGDLFDYGIEADRLTVAVMDAMGHGLGASVLAGMAVASLRNERRAGSSLAEMLQRTDRILHERSRGDSFVTAVLVEIDARTGEASIAAAGHPPARLLRDRQVSEVEMAARFPLGLTGTTTYHPTRFRLDGGDRLLLITDGAIDASSDGEDFGDRRLDEVLLATSKLPVGEAVRHLQHTLQTHTQPAALRDDATFVLIDWHDQDPG